ncbi:MAG: hypothetical protein JO051_16180 [Acidobacteriaceae bacterium]|nr:hypothetical protein [Acidobacteriaceae bacterium]
MGYGREANRGNHVVVITLLFGAAGLAYGISQLIGANPAQASNIGDKLLPALAAGAVWGVIGLVFGALTSAIVNGGFWSIPAMLVLALAFQSHLANH